jgi:hypothetical protein
MKKIIIPVTLAAALMLGMAFAQDNQTGNTEKKTGSSQGKGKGKSKSTAGPKSGPNPVAPNDPNNPGLDKFAQNLGQAHPKAPKGTGAAASTQVDSNGKPLPPSQNAKKGKKKEKTCEAGGPGCPAPK